MSGLGMGSIPVLLHGIICNTEIPPASALLIRFFVA